MLQVKARSIAVCRIYSGAGYGVESLSDNTPVLIKDGKVMYLTGIIACAERNCLAHLGALQVPVGFALIRSG